MIDKFIERIQFEFEEQPVPVKILKDTNDRLEREFAFILKKGQEKHLPLWIATELVTHGFAKLKENFIELSEIHDALKKEEEAHALQPIDEDFYLKVREQLRFLKKIDIESPKIEKIEALLRDILSMRLFKILKIASQTKNTRNFAEYMTKEEKILFQELSSMCIQWKNTLFSLE